MITKVMLKNVNMFKDACFELKNKHLAIVFGDWKEKDKLANSFQWLKYMVTDGDGRAIMDCYNGKRNATFSFEFDIDEVGIGEYTFAVNMFGEVVNEKLFCTMDKRRSTLFEKTCNGSQIIIKVHNSVWTDLETKAVFNYLTADKDMRFKSVFSILHQTLDRFILKKQTNISKKIISIAQYIESIDIPTFEHMLEVRRHTNDEGKLFNNIFNISANDGVVVLKDVDSLVNPLSFKALLETVEPHLEGQLIVFTNNLELMQIENASKYLFFLTEQKIKSIKDYDFRTFKNNNIREKYIKGCYCKPPTVSVDILIKNVGDKHERAV